MQLLFFCPRWGNENIEWDAFCSLVKDAGYNGIEAGVPFDEHEKQAMQNALQKYELKLVAQYWQSFENDFDAHLTAYISHLHHLSTLQPLKIDAQTGKDYFSVEQNTQLFTAAKNFTNQTGIAVAHETHRNKALFAAPVARQYFLQDPSLTITADFSHWCNVSESYLQDQQETIELAIPHCIHIHARVGHPEGPQVTDPRLPEWQEALQHHLGWWKKIKTHHLQQGQACLTINTEFGPAPYMPHHPKTKKPLANQWQINCWMMEYLKRAL
jgi:sugar phosphate isomerase/epimerase